MVGYHRIQRATDYMNLSMGYQETSQMEDGGKYSDLFPKVLLVQMQPFEILQCIPFGQLYWAVL